jgi:hypothetical protein
MIIKGKRKSPIRVQTKDNEIGIFFFSAQLAALRSMSKDRLAHNKDNVSE